MENNIGQHENVEVERNSFSHTLIILIYNIEKSFYSVVGLDF